MRNIFSHIKGIRNIKNQEDLSEVLEKITHVVDDKLVQMQQEQKGKQLDPVIIKDEDDNFIDCCNIVKPNEPLNYFEVASVVLKGLAETEKNVRYKLRRFTIIFYTILMLVYTIFNLSHITDLNNRTVMYAFFGMFALLFAVITVINILIYKNTKLNTTQTNRQLKMMKNYKSAAVILRRAMLLWSLGITVFSMLITWEEGPAYQVLNIFMLLITSCMLIYIIYREIRKVRMRAVAKEDGKFKIFFKTVSAVVKNTKTADIIVSGNSQIDAPKNQNSSEFKSNREKKKAVAREKKLIRYNNAEIKKAYKDNYKNELKKLKQQYLDNIDKL